MRWENVSLPNKIQYLKQLMNNSTVDVSRDVDVIDALITGSTTPFYMDDELQFKMQDSHITYMKNLWNVVVGLQKNQSIIDLIKSEVK